MSAVRLLGSLLTLVALVVLCLLAFTSCSAFASDAELYANGCPRDGQTCNVDKAMAYGPMAGSVVQFMALPTVQANGTKSLTGRLAPVNVPIVSYSKQEANAASVWMVQAGYKVIPLCGIAGTKSCYGYIFNGKVPR